MMNDKSSAERRKKNRDKRKKKKRGKGKSRKDQENFENLVDSRAARRSMVKKMPQQQLPMPVRGRS